MIRVSHLSKSFKTAKREEGPFSFWRNLFNTQSVIKQAINDICFDIQEGEIVGYLGPNGAGKSTTIKMLSGVLRPESGHIEINGFDPSQQKNEFFRHIGVVFGQKTQLWWDVPLIDSLQLLRDMYRVEEKRFKQNMQLFNEVLGINEFLHKPVRQLSLGQRMRSDLAAALLHNPEVIFLDEPTIGVDVITKQKIREFIQEINRKDAVTALVTTHDMNEIEKLCQRVIIINEGKIIFDGSLSALKLKYGNVRTAKLEFAEIIPPLNIHGLHFKKAEGKTIYYEYNPSQLSVTQLLKVLSEINAPLVDMSIEEADIEEIIRAIFLSQENKGRPL